MTYKIGSLVRIIDPFIPVISGLTGTVSGKDRIRSDTYIIISVIIKLESDESAITHHFRLLPKQLRLINKSNIKQLIRKYTKLKLEDKHI